MEKIELYKTRTFSEKLSDTIAFLRETWRPTLKYFIYLMLPISIVLAFFMNHFWGGYMQFVMNLENIGGSMDDSGLLSFGINALLMTAVYFVAYVVLSALVYALIRLYRARPNGLEGLANDEFVAELKTCMARAAVLILSAIVVFIILVAIVAVVVVGPFFVHPVFGFVVTLLAYVGALVILVPLMLVEPIYMLEDEVGIVDAYKKAIHLGFPTWGGIVAVTFVIGLLASVIQTVTTGPWYVLFLIKTFFTLQKEVDGSFVGSFLFTCFEYLSCVLQCLGMLLSSVLTLVSLTIQYGHAADKIDGVGVAGKIDKFDEFDTF